MCCAQHLMATVRAGLWRSAEAVARYGEARGVAVGDRRQTMMVTAAADAGQMDLCAWFLLYFSRPTVWSGSCNPATWRQTMLAAGPDGHTLKHVK